MIKAGWSSQGQVAWLLSVEMETVKRLANGGSDLAAIAQAVDQELHNSSQAIAQEYFGPPSIQFARGRMLKYSASQYFYLICQCAPALRLT
jgi:hypothetical protein